MRGIVSRVTRGASRGLPACGIVRACRVSLWRWSLLLAGCCSTATTGRACAGLLVSAGCCRRSLPYLSLLLIAAHRLSSLRLLPSCSSSSRHCWSTDTCTHPDSDTPRILSPSLAVWSASSLLASLAISLSHCVLLAALRIAYSLYSTVTFIYSLIYKEKYRVFDTVITGYCTCTNQTLISMITYTYHFSRK